MKYLMLLSALFLVISCKEAPPENQIDLQAIQNKIDSLDLVVSAYNNNIKGEIVHQVFLDLKDDISDSDRNLFLDELNALRHIPEVKHMRIGSFYDLEDPRAMANYDLVFEINFVDANSFKAYQNHQIHLDMKESLKRFLASPPVVYDFEIE